MATTNVAITESDLFNNSIFTVINKISRKCQRAGITAIFKEIIKNDHYKDINRSSKTTNKAAYNRRKTCLQN